MTLTTTTAGAVIHYTTDGSVPTESSPVYSGPIAVDKDATINAIAIAPGAPASEIASGAYTILPVAKKEKLELRGKIYFDNGKASIKPVSYGLLDEVAVTLKNRDVKKVEIAGHTDSVGGAAFNQRLSQQRADSVREYLVTKGVLPGRLEAKGFGEDQPIAPNNTALGREQNRRVEFTIAE